jgi:hypothetical protein
MLLLMGHAVMALPLPAEDATRFAEIPADVLADKIRGGMLGQILGNLNGLPHEFKYIHEPGNVETYTPDLPDGARTDDDTDLEWVYVCEMAKTGAVLLPPARIAALWKAHINRSLWCANLYARQLMDLGIEPPLTGHVAINPWADFNISGQFLCESFGLMAPGMPHTASKIGLHYTRVAIDGEPAQTTQLFCSTIAMAFVETDIEKIIEAGLAAVDPACEIRRVVEASRAWCREHPSDWRATRRLMKERYQSHNGEMRDKNGYEKDLSGSATEKARAAYLAICLGENGRLRKEQSAAWEDAIEALKGCPSVLKQVFEAPKPSATSLQERMTAEGLAKPGK